MPHFARPDVFFTGAVLTCIGLLVACARPNTSAHVDQGPPADTAGNPDSAVGTTTRSGPEDLAFQLDGPQDLPTLGEVTDIALSTEQDGHSFFDVLGTSGWVRVNAQTLVPVGEVVAFEKTPPSGFFDNAKAPVSSFHDANEWCPNRWISFSGTIDRMIIKDRGPPSITTHLLSVFDRAGKLVTISVFPFRERDSYAGTIEALVWDRRTSTDDFLVFGTANEQALRMDRFGKILGRTTVPRFNVQEAKAILYPESGPIFAYGSEGTVAVVRLSGEYVGKVRACEGARFVNAMDPVSSNPPVVRVMAVNADRRSMDWHLVSLEELMKVPPTTDAERSQSRPNPLEEITTPPPPGSWEGEFTLAGKTYDVRMQDLFVSDTTTCGTNRALDFSVVERNGPSSWRHVFGSTGVGRAQRVVGPGRLMVQSLDPQTVSLVVCWGQSMWRVSITR